VPGVEDKYRGGVEGEVGAAPRSSHL